MLWGAKKIRILLFKQYPKGTLTQVGYSHIHQKMVRNTKRRQRVKRYFPYFFDPKKAEGERTRQVFICGNQNYCHPWPCHSKSSVFCLRQKDITRRNLQSPEGVYKGFRKVRWSLENRYITDQTGSPFGSVAAIQKNIPGLFHIGSLNGNASSLFRTRHVRPEWRHERMHRDVKGCLLPNPHQFQP